MPKSKTGEVLSFKVDAELSKLIKRVPNRSAFIRNAILEAFGNFCPFCKGTGILTPHKKEHWDEFSKKHEMKECRDCHEPKMECRE